MRDSYAIAGGSVDITPRTPIALAGYATLRKPVFDRVAQPIEANVLLLQNGSGVAVFVSLDLMYVGARLRDRITEGLRGRVPAEALFISASHTHFGPATEESLVVLGAVNSAYVGFVADCVVSLIERLLTGSSRAVSAEYCSGRAAHSINRRKKAFGIKRHFPFVGSEMRILPNIAGPRDDAIRLIRLLGSNGKVAAICWSYACHPVAFPNLNELTAEYPGVIRQMLRADHGDIPVIFWQGFSGNIRPRMPAGSGNGSGSDLPPTFDPVDREQWDRWAQSLGECVRDTLRQPARSLEGPISHAVRRLSLTELGLSTAKRLAFQEIRLGNDVAVCGLNAEVAVEYVELFERLIAPVAVIPVGCVGDVFGYLPASSMVPEGGYEVRGFVPRFGLRGQFGGNVSNVVEKWLQHPSA